MITDLNQADLVAFDNTHQKLYPHQYLDGIKHFNAGDYYQAHEVWEEIWLRSSGQEKLFYQMLIQSAVSLLHHERGNVRGSLSMYSAVMEKLARLPSVFMSLDLADFSQQMKRFFSEAAPTVGDNLTKPKPQIRLLRSAP
jgi:predicted metal-dependent hydrolase